MIKRTWKIPLFKIYWDDKDVEAVIKAGMNWAVCPNVVLILSPTHLLN